MGHSRIGTLPATRKWKDVVKLIADGADVAQVAAATLRAAERAFSLVKNDVGFREATRLLVELAQAAGSKNPVGHLESVGLALSEKTSLAEVAMVLSETLDRRISATRQRSDFGKIAGGALISAVVNHLQTQASPLFGITRDEIGAVFKGMSRKQGFGELSQSFFSNLTSGSLDYFLSKNLATHLGEGLRFPTNNQKAQFDDAMHTHCKEASVIVKDYGTDWFSKHRHEEGGKISRESTDGYASYAMEKIKMELAVRAKQNENG